MKKCSKCNITKNIDEFYPHKQYSQGVFHLCKICHKNSTKKGQRKYYEKNMEAVKSKSKLYYQENKEVVLLKMRNNYFKNKFGITTEEYDVLLVENGPNCNMCDEVMKKPKLDHNHSTGKIRSFLCSRCNIFLGYIETCPELISFANKYLKNFDD